MGLRISIMGSDYILNIIVENLWVGSKSEFNHRRITVIVYRFASDKLTVN